MLVALGSGSSDESLSLSLGTTCPVPGALYSSAPLYLSVYSSSGNMGLPAKAPVWPRIALPVCCFG